MAVHSKLQYCYINYTVSINVGNLIHSLRFFIFVFNVQLQLRPINIWYEIIYITFIKIFLNTDMLLLSLDGRVVNSSICFKCAVCFVLDLAFWCNFSW